MRNDDASRCRRRQAGLTLIELMIAVTVALVILAALAVMYGTSVKARNQIERVSRQIENGRYAIQVLRDDIQLAGFFGEYNIRDFPPALPPALPDVCVTHLTANTDLPADNVASSDLTGDATIDGLDYLAAVMGMHVQGFDDVDVGALPDCLSAADVRPDTDIVVVRRAATCDQGATNCPFMANAPYLQGLQCDLQIRQRTEVQLLPPFLLRADADAAAFTFTDLTCNAANTTPVRRFLTHMYYVANNNVAGDGVPTLKRRELVAGGFTTTALVEGIEELQVEYGIDNSGDGSPDVYVSDPADDAGSPSAQAAWSNVMSVRVNVLSRSTEARSDFTDTNTYTLANKDIPAQNDHYMRQVFQTVVPMRNAAGRRQ